YERLWNLSVLQIFDFSLAQAELEPIRQDSTGCVCEGGLELVLTGGMLCFMTIFDLGYKCSLDVIAAVTEALKQVEMIVNIEHHLWDLPRNYQTPTLIKMHNVLIHTRSLTKEHIVELLILHYIHYMIVENTPDEEIHHLYLIK
ncbi:hypothetical protein DFH28DRAFT_883782, partial [Melampsora americana]